MKIKTHRTRLGQYMTSITVDDGATFAATAPERRQSRRKALNLATAYTQQQKAPEGAPEGPGHV